MSAILGVIDSSRRRAAAAGTVLGYNGKAATVSLVDGNIFASKVTLASAKTLTELHANLLQGSGVSWQVVLCIYSDTGGTAPLNRLAATSPLSVSAGSADQEVSQTGFSVALAAGSYWIGINSSGFAAPAACYDNSTGGSHVRSTAGAAFNPPPASWPGTQSSGTRQYSVWAVVT